MAKILLEQGPGSIPELDPADDPVGCSENIGKAALRIEAERVAEVFKMIKEDEDLLKWNAQIWNSDKN